MECPIGFGEKIRIIPGAWFDSSIDCDGGHVNPLGLDIFCQAVAKRDESRFIDTERRIGCFRPSRNSSTSEEDRSLSRSFHCRQDRLHGDESAQNVDSEGLLQCLGRKRIRPNGSDGGRVVNEYLGISQRRLDFLKRYRKFSAVAGIGRKGFRRDPFRSQVRDVRFQFDPLSGQCRDREPFSTEASRDRHPNPGSNADDDANRLLQ